jgi:outer membrane autotransporter protein
MPRRAAMIGVIGAAALHAAVSARGDSFTISTTDDAGAGSLRDAVDAGIEAGGETTLTFSVPDDSTITLGSPLASLFDATSAGTWTFDATGSPGLLIDGGDLEPFLDNCVEGDTPGTVDCALNVDVTFRNVSYAGGAIRSNGNVFTLDESGSGVIGGNLVGTDLTLIKTGSGTTTLTADNLIYLDEQDTGSIVRIEQGTLAIEAGEIVGDTIQAGLSADTVVVLPQGTLIVGDTGYLEAFSLESQGSLIVNGSVSAQTVDLQGDTIVNGILDADSVDVQGQLALVGAIGATTLEIGPAGLLVGDAPGTIIADTTVSGTVAPSGASGTLSFTGPLRFTASSMIDVDVAPGGADQLDVTGDVTIDPGARVVFDTDPTEIADAQDFTLLTSDAPIEGSFALGTDYAFLDETLVTSGNLVRLSLAPNGLGFSSFAQTPNQRNVAAHLEAASPGATGDLADALDAMGQATSAEIPALLDAIGGESLTAFATARQILAERTSRALHRRVRDPVWGSGRAFYQSDRYAVDPDEAPLRGGAWFDALGVYGELDGDTGEAEVDTLLYGGTLGGDLRIREHLVVGLAAGYARSDVDLDDRDADLFGDTIQGALYAGFVDPRGYASVYGRYAYTFETSRRTIEAGTLSRRARAKFDAQDWGAGGELGLTVLSFRGVALQPIAGIDWLRMDEESYTERGAGDLSLSVDPETLESTTTRFGGRLFGRFDMGGEMGTLVPELRAFYQHLSGDRERALDARLTGAPGLGSLGVRGAELPRESFLVGVGWGVLVGTNLTVSIDYDAVLGSDRAEHQATLAARVMF